MNGFLLTLLWLAQLVGCLCFGYFTARKTGRSVLNWIVMGFLLAIVFPPVGLAVSALAYFFYPPLMPKYPVPEPPDSSGLPDGRRRPRPRA